MTRRLLTALLAGAVACGSAWADESPQEPRKHRSKTDSLYVQLYGGINKSANENLPWTEFSSYPWAGGAFVGIGKEFRPLWGWRAVVGFDKNKSRNVRECESPDTWSWLDVEAFGDITFDLSDALHFSTKRFNMKAFAGAGVLWTFGFPMDTPLSYTVPYSRNSRLCVGPRAGLTATYKVAPRMLVGAELSHTMVNDPFNGVVDGFAMDGRTNLSVGMNFFFGPRERKKAPATTAPVVYVSRLKEMPLLPFVLPSRERQKTRTVSGRAFLDFPVNETVIYPDYRRNPSELSRIRATVDSAQFDASIQITRISLHGYASPESPYSNNTRLAKGRTAALKQYMQKHYGFEADIFVNEYTPEDWENLRTYIEDNMSTGQAARRTVKNSVWYDSKNVVETPQMPDEVRRYGEALLAVINSGLEPDAKEEELKKVGGGAPYKWLLTNVYPGLRHTDYIIEYVVKEYTVAESRKLIYRHPEALSVNEMYQVANYYAVGSDSWYDALVIAAQQYPNDETANLNAACACVQKKRLKDARAFLAFAGESEAASYLHDVIDAMEGKIRWKMVDGKVVKVEDDE